MIIYGRGLSSGTSKGTLVSLDELKSVSHNSGDEICFFNRVRDRDFKPSLLKLNKDANKKPKGLITDKAGDDVIDFANDSNIPLVDNIQLDILKEGDRAIIDGCNGTVNLSDVKEQPVVTVFLQKGGKILLLRRSEDVGSYRGKWGAVSGYQELEPLEQAMVEIEEETSMEAKYICKGEPVLVRYQDIVWRVEPMLFETQDEPSLNWENTMYRWVEPEKIKELDTVPKLWQAYESVRRSKDANKNR